jgi:hypothetical protein
MNLGDLFMHCAGHWMEYAGIIVGGGFARLTRSRPSNTKRIRRQLKRSLPRFAHVAPARLEEALLDLEEERSSGRRALAGIMKELLAAVLLIALTELLQELMPRAPFLIPLAIVVAVLGAMMYPIGRIERRTMLHRLEERFGTSCIS